MKKLLIFGSLWALASIANAQLVSHNQNTAPLVGGFFDWNTAIGWNVLSSCTPGVGINNTGTGFNALNFNTTGNHNTAMGNFVLQSNTTGIYNTAIGMNSMQANISGGFNVGNGNTSLFLNNSGNNNTAIGFESMRQNSSGNNNAANGFQSLYWNNGDFNTANGYQALFWSNSTLNTALGYQSGFNNSTGTNNTYVGNQTAGVNPNTSTGSNNSALGSQALGNITTADRNSAIGVNAGFSLTTGNDNCVFGYGMADLITTGNRNIYIGSDGGGGGFNNANGNNNVSVGYRAGYFLPAGSNNNVFLGSTAGVTGGAVLNNAIAIGSGSLVTTSNRMILGNNTVNVGIGMSAVAGGPLNKLELNCDIPPATPFTFSTPFDPVIPGSWLGPGSGASGLRFRDLTSASTPISTPAEMAPAQSGVDITKVLSVDKNGDVVLIKNGLGNSCGAAQYPLTGSWEIPLNNNNYIFSGQGPIGNINYRVGIGTSCNPGNKLEIDNGVLNPNTSGLRLTQLTSLSPTSINPGLGVLAVDAAGDIIYVPGGGAPLLANNGLQISGGFVQLGGNCSNVTEIGNAALLTDRHVNLNSQDLIFGDVGGVNGRVGIGFFTPGACIQPGNLLEVRTGNLSNTSGLRLTDLMTMPGLPANGQTLSIDPTNGDVILTQAAVSAAGPGNYCGYSSFESFNQ